jgi:hypothetical protein
MQTSDKSDIEDLPGWLRLDKKDLSIKERYKNGI